MTHPALLTHPALHPAADRRTLDAWTNRPVPGGCDHCPATQTLTRTTAGEYVLTTVHHDDCPVLITQMDIEMGGTPTTDTAGTPIHPAPDRIPLRDSGGC